MTIREKTRVRVIAGYYEGKTGKINSVHPEAGVAIVSFDDNGDVGKVELAHLIEIQDQPEEKAPEIPEIPEGAKQISRADFDKAIDDLVSPARILFSGGNPHAVVGKLGAILASRRTVADKIFNGATAVTMTEDEFISALWIACDPRNMIPGDKSCLSARRMTKLAVATVIGLEEVVEILFGSPENG